MPVIHKAAYDCSQAALFQSGMILYFICLALFVITDRVRNLTQRYKLMQKSLSLKDKEYDIMIPDWAKEMNCAVTVSDKEGIIIYMNDKAKDTFAKHGDLIGKSLIPCHNDN